MGHLNGKVAVVTGAGRGIGRAEARMLAGLGASVIVNDIGTSWDGAGAAIGPAREVVDEIIEAGGRAEVNTDDVADWEGAKRLIVQAVESFGGLDILVCNAGFVRDRMLFNLTEEDWTSVVRVHLNGHFFPLRHAATFWRERSKAGNPVAARVVLTSSEAGLYGSVGQANYGAAKTGIATLGVIAARELETYGVEVNTIAPRARTRLNENTFGEFVSPDGEVDLWSPDNVAGIVAFLSSPSAQGISGQTFVAGAGVLELMQGFQVANHLEDRDACWTVEAVLARVDELFEGRSRQPAPLEFEMPVAPGA